MGACDFFLYDRTATVDNLETGDVVLFNADWEPYPVYHRVIYTDESFVMTKGDALPYIDDQKITEDELYGEVIVHIDTPDPSGYCTPPWVVIDRVV